MEWTAQVDNYCERTDLSYWSEPVNALTNAAFLIAAMVAWFVLRDRRDPGTLLLLVILTAIGIGSFLFHTHATRWAGVADVLPIMFYILVYLYLATVRMVGLPWWAGAFAVILFFPFTAIVSGIVSVLTGGLNGSEGYVPTLLLIAGYGLWLRGRAPSTGRGLLIGAGILTLSLTARSVDAAVCEAIPLGTHWLWHCLNGVMLGWMIVVMDRHRAVR
ncbi:ceramidase domain-containing protein [Roseobacter sp. HKCCA0434]|uniref:ceramidase domain-containing protein n=1 Tax=Roseobacter sp. HKCCA0434 TaxID=3079297 RepID=UPI002905F772|nr:ceramidase domain-containing protein [Roseobacter sp. HKCCA0434]